MPKRVRTEIMFNHSGVAEILVEMGHAIGIRKTNDGIERGKVRRFDLTELQFNVRII